MDIQECYRILNVKQGADWSEIKKSFHALARAHHPDRHGGHPAREETFKQISRAYETLERWYQSHSFSYRVYKSTGTVVKSGPSPNDGYLSSLEKFPDRTTPLLFRWTAQVRDWLQRYEARWLELDVKRTVTIDAVTASQGGILKIKNPSGSFHVQVPRQTPHEAVVRIPGKGDVGLFNRKPGDLLLKIVVDPGKSRPREIVEYFYQVRIPEDQLREPKVRSLSTCEGPIQYRLPKKLRNGQTFRLKSKPDPETGRTSHHILVIDLL